MQNGYCVVGNCRCHHTKHFNVGYRVEQRSKQVTETSNDLKAKYVDASSKKSSFEQILQGATSELCSSIDLAAKMSE